MHIGFQRSTIHWCCVNVIVQSPKENVSHVVVDVEMNFLWRNGKFGINFLVNELELFYKLFP
jgi:hypothetical protein